MELTFSELLEGLNGKVIIEGSNKEFNKLSTDTRTLEERNVFLALKGENFNGNKYVKNAYEKGATIIVIDEILEDLSEYVDKCTIIKVNDGNEALLSLAKYYREKLGIKVVGVTGSCGKTSTKDLVHGFLSEKYKVFKTKGNFNNHIGLPLMILELDHTYDVAVLELGMSNLGEIDVLANCSRPDIALITNIGLSHIENLKTRDNILKAKMEITNFFNKDNTLIVNAEDDLLAELKEYSFKIIKTGYNNSFNIYAENIILNKETTKFTAVYNNERYDFVLPMVGAHNVLNALLAIGAAIELGVSFDEMIKGLINMENTSMRLEFIEGNDITIINDCYNASPDSMKAAIDVLSGYGEGRKIAILGTMNELGDEAIKSHTEVGEYASSRIDLLITTGEFKDNYRNGFGNENIEIYNSKHELINSLKNIIKKDDVILVKASRGIKFEEIVTELKDIIPN